MSKLFWDKFLTTEQKTISTQTEEQNTSLTITKIIRDTKNTQDTTNKKNELLSISKRLDELLESIGNLRNLLFIKNK